MGYIELQSTKVEKNLGVYVDEKLKFHQNILFAVNKSSRMLWIVKKTFSYLDEDTAKAVQDNCQTPPEI